MNFQFSLLVFSYKAEQGFALVIVFGFDLGCHSQLPIYLVSQIHDALLLPHILSLVV